MGTSSSILAAGSEAMESVVGLPQTLIDLFFTPSRAFMALRQRQWWVIPFLLCVATAVLFEISTAHYRMEDLKQDIKSNPTYSTEEVARRLANIDMQARSHVTLRQLTFATVALGAVHAIKLFGLALVIWLALQLYTSRASYIAIVSLCSFVFLIRIPEAVVTAILTNLKGTAKVFLGPAIALPSAWFQSPLFHALDKLDIFSVWMAFLLVIGLPIVAELPRKKSVLMISYLWIVWLLANALLSNLIRIA